MLKCPKCFGDEIKFIRELSSPEILIVYHCMKCSHKWQDFPPSVGV